MKGAKVNGNVPYTREVADNLDVQLLQQIRATDTRALEDLPSCHARHQLVCKMDKKKKKTTDGVPRVPELRTTHLFALTYAPPHQK